MSDPARGTLRLARSGAFVAACLLLAVGGHAYGGGGWPSPAAIGLLCVPVTLLGVWFTRRERGIGALFGTLAAVQVVLHAVLHLCAAGPARLAVVGSHGHVDSLEALASGGGSLEPAALHGLGVAASSGPGAHLAGSGWLPAPGMITGHVLAVGLTAVLLGWGERSLWAWCRSVLPRLPGVATPPTLAGVAAARRASARGPAMAVARREPIRGPPVGAFA